MLVHDLIGKPEDRFSQDAAHIIVPLVSFPKLTLVDEQGHQELQRWFLLTIRTTVTVLNFLNSLFAICTIKLNQKAIEQKNAFERC